MIYHTVESYALHNTVKEILHAVYLALLAPF